MSNVIKPTVGRVVWFYPETSYGAEPNLAFIAGVHDDHQVNLAVFDSNGNYAGGHQCVFLAHDAESVPPTRPYCKWMPFQKGQAAKTDDGIAKLEARVAVLEQIDAEAMTVDGKTKADLAAEGLPVTLTTASNPDVVPTVTATPKTSRKPPSTK